MMNKIKSWYYWCCNNYDIICLLVLLAIAVFSTYGCSRQQIAPIQKTEIRYIDSTIWHTDTSYIEIPREKDADVVWMFDTLWLETSTADAWAVVDTTNKTLKGKLENKNTKLPVETKWVEKIVTKDSLVYIDRPVEKKIVEYKTPKAAKWYMAILTILCLGWIVYLLRKPIIKLLKSTLLK